MTLAGKQGYMETSIGWLPSDWSATSFGSLLSEKPEYGANASAEDFGGEGYVRYIRITDIDETGALIESNKKYLPSTVAKGYLLAENDLLIARTGNTVGKSLLFRSHMGECAFAGYLIRFRVGNALDCNFASQTLRSDAYWAWVKSSSKVGAQPNINSQQYQSLMLPFPPLPEQQKIAAILTAVDDKLDVIARQITVIQTLKQGLMQTLFSRGVGIQDAAGCWVAHTEFKDSELGEIPKGWGVQPLGALAESITVGIATSTTEHYVENGVPLIRNQNIKEDFLDMSDLLKVSPEFDQKNKRKRVMEGDILTVRTGYPGVSCVVPEGLGHLQTFTTLITRLNRKLIDPNFASRYFNSPQGKGLMLHQAAGGAQQNINAGNLKKLLVSVPPLVEQEQIAEILGAVDAKGCCLENKKKYYQTLKRGLMQKLLTGEWRVKLDSPASLA